MTYEAFKETLLAELSGHFPPDTSIHIHSIPRNNQVAVDGLTILESGFNIAPTIYIQEYYDKLQDGASFLDVFRQLLDTYYEYRPLENINPTLFQDFQNMKDHIVYRLIHYDRNQPLLETIPHLPFLDLAIVFYCLIASNDSGTATILIQNYHLQLWNTNTDELYRLARENTPTLLSPRFDPLSQMLDELSAFLSPPKGDENTASAPTNASDECPLFPMYVLTNQCRFYGAACVLYHDLLADLAANLNTDLYLIPSSVHEMLIIPATSDMTREDFNRMIQEVNATQLEPEEILSDHVYYYSREEMQMRV